MGLPAVGPSFSGFALTCLHPTLVAFLGTVQTRRLLGQKVSLGPATRGH